MVRGACPASSDDARKLGYALPGKQKRSAAKLVDSMLATTDEVGRLWLTQEAQIALGLPRVERDEAMRAKQREASR